MYPASFVGDLHPAHPLDEFGRPAALPERPARQSFWWDLGGCDFDEVSFRCHLFESD